MKKPMTEDEIQGLAEWIADEYNRALRVMTDSTGKTLYFERGLGTYELSDNAGDVSIHRTLHDGVRAFEAHKARPRPLLKL